MAEVDPAAAAAASAAAKPWYDGKLDAELIGHAQNKNWKIDDPATLAVEALKGAREAQKMIGVPAEKLLRIPEPSAPEADVSAFWNRIGVPAEAKDYDFTGIKRADGKDLDEKTATTLRTALLAGRVTKDRAADVVKAIIKEQDDAEAARKTDIAASVQTETQALDKSWGVNKEANLFVAKNALLKLGQAAGLPPDKAQAAWDALSKVGGIGAASAMEMLRVMGSRMGEDRFVSNGAPGGNNLPMTREAAVAEIGTLKADPQFRKRYLEGGAEETKRMKALHAIAYGQQQAA